MFVTMTRWSLPLILLVAACGIYRITRAQTKVENLVELPASPNVIAPRYDIPMVATDQQLHAVMDRMLPTSIPPVKTNILVHALRLWGPDAKFATVNAPDGRTMLDYFLNDETFRQLAGDDVPPLFSRTKDGILPRPWERNAPHRLTAAMHVDDLLATLAESGVSLSTPLHLRDETVTVGDLFTSSMRRFHRRQHEYEWSAISYARYLFPNPRWENQYGQTIDVDALVVELLEQPAENGICGGTHRLEALVVLNRADEQYSALSRSTKRKLLSHLAETSALLIQTQHPEGYWSRSWHSHYGAAEDTSDTRYDRILLTGHHLEWLALAPPEVQPPRDVIIRAGQWLVRAMLEEPAESLHDHFGPFTHAARALCLWRSKDPYQAWTAGQATEVSADAIPSN